MQNVHLLKNTDQNCTCVELSRNVRIIDFIASYFFYKDSFLAFIFIFGVTVSYVK